MTNQDLNTRANELLSRVADLNDLLLQGQLLEAHDRFYAEDVVQQENESEPMVGKAANREREAQFLESITDFRAAEVKSVAVDPANSRTMVEWFYDYDHAEWGTRRYHQVAVQEWRDGLIARERYYYGA